MVGWWVVDKERGKGCCVVGKQGVKQGKHGKMVNTREEKGNRKGGKGETRGMSIDPPSHLQIVLET